MKCMSAVFMYVYTGMCACVWNLDHSPLCILRQGLSLRSLSSQHRIPSHYHPDLLLYMGSALNPGPQLVWPWMLQSQRHPRPVIFLFIQHFVLNVLKTDTLRVGSLNHQTTDNSFGKKPQTWSWTQELDRLQTGLLDLRLSGLAWEECDMSALRLKGNSYQGI